MDREKIYADLLGKIEQTFTPTDEEMSKLKERLEKYDDTELTNFTENFSTFGVEAVLECLFGIKSTHKNDQ
jgi:hypothetical protein